MTDEQLLIEANRLCRALAEGDGYTFPVGHHFETNPSPRARKYWDMASIAYEVIRATDLHDLLANLDIDLPARPERLPGMRTPKARSRR